MLRRVTLVIGFVFSVFVPFQIADAQIFKRRTSKGISSYSASNGHITNTSCSCAMCNSARAAAAAGKTKFCYGGKCYPIFHSQKTPSRYSTFAPRASNPKPVTSVTASPPPVVAPVTSPPLAIRLASPAPLQQVSLPYSPAISSVSVAKPRAINPSPTIPTLPASETVVSSRIVPAKPIVTTSAPVAENPVTKLDPTPHDATTLMVALAGVSDQDVVYDLGCGDGRLLVKASECGARRCVGIEVNPKTVEIARQRIKGRPNVAIIEGSFFESNFDDADVVFTYLYSGMLKELAPRLKNLQPGTRIVSYCHDIPGLCTRRHQIDGHVFYTATIDDDTAAVDDVASESNSLVSDWL